MLNAAPLASTFCVKQLNFSELLFPQLVLRNVEIRLILAAWWLSIVLESPIRWVEFYVSYSPNSFVLSF